MNIKKFEKALVTNNSVVIYEGKILQDSCVSIGHFQKYLKLKFRLKYFFPIFCDDKKSYILITDEWSKNYCHWLWEALTKLIILKKEFPQALLILPKSYLKIDFVMKSLAALGFNQNNIKIIPKKSHLRLKNLAFIPCINISTKGYYNFLRFNEVALALTSFYEMQFKTNFGKNIYISRNNPEKSVPRCVENEKELTQMLTKFGFKTVYMENFSFLEQLSIITNAKFILASHGAGITNFMFCKPDSYLFEMVNEKWAKTCFAEMCERQKTNYYRFSCSEVSDDRKNMELRDIKVNVENLEKILISFLK